MRTRRHREETLMRLWTRSDASARSSTPPERIAFDPHQHLSPSRAHRDRLRRRSRARRAENSRGAVKRKRERFARRTRVAFLNPSHTPAKPLINPKNRAIHRAHVAPRRRVSTASRSIGDEEHSFFRSRAFVSAENVPVRESALKCHGLELKS